MNKPYNSIKQIFSKNDINTGNIFFIDCITASVAEPKKEENVLFVSGPSDLTSLSIAIGQLLESIPGEKFLVIDTLRTLLIYNKSETVAAFVSSIIEKVSGFKLKTVIFTTEGKNKELINKIVPFFDKIIYSGKNKIKTK